VSSTAISDVSVATIAGALPAPVVFGDWIMRHREYAVVRVTTSSGHEGWAFTLTRDGAVAEQIRKSIAPVYVGNELADRERLFRVATRRSLASHSSGVGLRAVSIVDLAVWDAAAKVADTSIAGLLGGRNEAMPATAIIGYPPAQMGPDETGKQTAELYEAGWRRFKAPVAATPELSAERLRAARSAAPDAWIGCDAAWIYDDVEPAAEFVESIEDVGLGWFEDVFPPGDARLVRQLRERVSVPIAMGDEQGGSYYPEALLQAEAVDVVRIDLTCMGGITGGRRVIDRCVEAGVDFAPHMFAHVHSQVFAALGHAGVPIEWGVQWTGVDPYADSLVQPVIEAGLMAPLPEQPGFGCLLDVGWATSQAHDDPHRIFDSFLQKGET
jgi:L-alanine-DL-glutamate epimerase-like enolase superfamily enzyme